MSQIGENKHVPCYTSLRVLLVQATYLGILCKHSMLEEDSAMFSSHRDFLRET